MFSNVRNILQLIFIAFTISWISDSLSFAKDIYVVDHGWHAGIIIEQADIDSSFYKNKPSFPTARYLEIGWGDWDFYQNESRNIDYFLLTKAILYPTRSVLHLVGFNKKIKIYFPISKIVHLTLSDSAFGQLIQYINNSFELMENGKAVPLKSGLYGESIFYESKEYYIFPKTCNVWIAKALLCAGIDIEPYRYQQSDRLLERLIELGAKIIR